MDGASEKVLFVSYRRDDSRATSGRLRDTLRSAFGEHRVFQDVDGKPGSDYPRVLEDGLERSAVVLIVIGRKWLDLVGGDRTRRIDNPGDWVRRETEFAVLANNAIPVLVDDAEMPLPDSLPEVLRPLGLIHGVRLFNDQWDASASGLIEAIQQRTGWTRLDDTTGRIFGRPPIVIADFLPRAEYQLLDEAGARVVSAIYGIGGVGKSQLAAKYFTERHANYDNASWIDMRSDGGRVDFAGIAQALGLPHDRSTVIDVVRNYLTRDEGSWLLVFDNVEDPAQIEPLLPQGDHLKIVLTSKYRAWGHLADVVDVGLFDPLRAAQYLADRAQRAVDASAHDLARDLGYLPLALSLAGALCREQQLSFDYYRAERLPVDLIEALSPGDAGTYDKSVEALWQESLRCVSQLDLRAAALIELISLIGWVSIDRDWLSSRAGIERPELDRRLGLLASYSLIELSVDRVAIKHNLIADGIALMAHDSGRGDDVAAFFNGSVEKLGADAKTVASTAGTILHLQVLVSEHPQMVSAALVPVLIQATEQLNHRADASFEFQEQVVALATALLGRDHEDTLMARANLALAYWHSGKVDESVECAEALVRDGVQTLGKDHEEALTNRSILGACYTEAGRIEDAIAIEEQLVKDRERVLGRDHKDTINSRANLANSYTRIGRIEEAIAIEEKVVADRISKLGLSHPDTLTSRANLASSYTQLGRLEEVLEMEEAVLAERIEVLGVHHPDTLNSRNNLTFTYAELGRKREAIELCELLLADYRALLGDEHPETLGCLHNLAFYKYEVGRLDEALRDTEVLVEASERLLGEAHPDTLTSLNNLALIYAELGRDSEAVEVGERVLAHRQRIFGPDHRETIRGQHNLAGHLAKTGAVERAVELEQAVVEAWRGEDLSAEELTRALLELGALLKQAGRGQESREALLEALQLQAVQSGPESEEAAMTMELLSGLDDQLP